MHRSGTDVIQQFNLARNCPVIVHSLICSMTQDIIMVMGVCNTECEWVIKMVYKGNVSTARESLKLIFEIISKNMNSCPGSCASKL